MLTSTPTTPPSNGCRLTALQFAAVNAGVRWAASAYPAPLQELLRHHQEIADTLAGDVTSLNVPQWLATLAGVSPDADAVATFWQAAAGDAWRAKTGDVEWLAAWTAAVLTVAGIAHWNASRTAATA
jgi:hypothetical protein